ncbi:MAG: cofactor assembly of complex C subunit B [Scytonema sp. PMC 1069.18]|nr:cofactor assembly of complex C subunit B [Scytonema sp. PMC 1069.18]MEC4887225.1 cofactor assembly of complex C subunit B [Scytonema sp. PMC 1070.18]
MDTAVLPSTLLLTLLLSIGLFFFIRASTKDRTKTEQLVSEQDEETLMPRLREYFQSRSYRVVEVDPEQNRVFFEGYVRPSLFLAIFLTLLSVSGFLCLSLVLFFLFPNLNRAVLGIVLLSPLSGVVYWQKAGKLEKVSLKLEATRKDKRFPSKMSVTAHRDELIELRRALNLEINE